MFKYAAAFHKNTTDCFALTPIPTCQTLPINAYNKIPHAIETATQHSEEKLTRTEKQKQTNNNHNITT